MFGLLCDIVPWPTQVRGVEGRSVQVSSTSSSDVLWSDGSASEHGDAHHVENFCAPSHTMRAARSCREVLQEEEMCQVALSCPPLMFSSLNTEQERIVFSVLAASRPDSPIRPQMRQVDWRQGIASDKELMDRATWKMVGTGGSAVSSMLGQLPTSAEIEEVRGSRAGRWTRSSMLRKTQLVKCILRATSDGWQACMHGVRSRRRAVTDQRWTLCLLLLTPSEHE